jgi:hypothetical protein
MTAPAVYLASRTRKNGEGFILGRDQPPGRARPVRLLEAVVEKSPVPMALVMHLPGSARLEIRAAQQAVLAAALVRALEKPC